MRLLIPSIFRNGKADDPRHDDDHGSDPIDVPEGGGDCISIMAVLRFLLVEMTFIPFFRFFSSYAFSLFFALCRSLPNVKIGYFKKTSK